jgi:four helix bundle protein
MQDHRKLRVWNRAQELCVEVYQLTADYPSEERYGLIAQVRKAAVSVGANIAEGSRRVSRKDKARILNVGQGEAAEVMSELDVACRLGFGSRAEAQRLVEEYDKLGASVESFRQTVLAGEPRD